METRFIDNGDGTVTDTTTGLMWQQETAEEMTWEEAVRYCENLSLAGHNDWRLSTVHELQSLVDYTRDEPAIDANAFPGTKPSHYWSSTTYARNTTLAWCVVFNHGYGSPHNKSDTLYVRAVRGGQSGLLGNSAIKPGNTPSVTITVTFNPQENNCI